MAEPDWPQKTIWRMCIACWIPNVTNTHTDCVTHIAFPLQQWLQERPSMSHFTSVSIITGNIVRVVKSRRMRWAGHVARMGEDKGVHRMLVGKPEGKRPLGRSRRSWEDNIKMDIQEVGGGLGDWMELAQDRDGWRALVGTVRNFRDP